MQTASHPRQRALAHPFTSSSCALAVLAPDLLTPGRMEEMLPSKINPFQAPWALTPEVLRSSFPGSTATPDADTVKTSLEPAPGTTSNKVVFEVVPGGLPRKLKFAVPQSKSAFTSRPSISFQGTDQTADASGDFL